MKTIQRLSLAIFFLANFAFVCSAAALTNSKTAAQSPTSSVKGDAQIYRCAKARSFSCI